MSGILVAFEIAVLVPLFVAKWRTSVLGLFVQGALMSWMVLERDPHLSIDTVASLVDLLLVRTLAAPAAIYLVLRARGAPRRNDVIAPNLFSWALALALVVVAFRSTDVLVPEEGDLQLEVAVAASAFVLGLFILATSNGIVSQVIGLARMENAIALFELGGGARAPLGIRIGETVLLVAAIGLWRWYLVHLLRDPSEEHADTETAIL